MSTAAPDLFPHHSEERLRVARGHLAAVDAAPQRAEPEVPPLAWRKRPGGFAGLVKMVVEQQVSVASAAAIWRRVENGLGEISPTRVLHHSEDELKTFGLSRPKARYARAIAEAVNGGTIDFDGLIHLQDDEAVARLTALKGVGRWTAETYLMFCEGRLDVFPAGDVGRWTAEIYMMFCEGRI